MDACVLLEEGETWMFLGWEIAEEVRRTRFVWAMSQSPNGVGGALFGGEDWRSRKIVGRGM